MARKAALTFGLLVVLCGLVGPAPSWAQLSSAPQSCSSSPGTNENSQTNAVGNVRNSDGTGDVHRKVIVDRIEFDRPVHLSDFDVDQIIKTANEMEADADADPSPWVDELAEIGLRSAWQDQGYFKIVLTAHAKSIGGDSDHERFLVAVHVENEGPQFHLGDILFTGGTGIPEAELRQVIPLREGEIFSVAKVRASIEALTKLYGSHGYIDFTVVPDTEVDEHLQRISIVMHLDEQKQFHVGSIEIRGLDPNLEARLRSIIVPGHVFVDQSIDAFFKENQSILPARALEDHLQLTRNVRTGIVDITFDAHSCTRSEIQESATQQFLRSR
jgi:hypothetical protein